LRFPLFFGVLYDQKPLSRLATRFRTNVFFAVFRGRSLRISAVKSSFLSGGLDEKGKETRNAASRPGGMKQLPDF
jgi:hypothetical protein